MSLYIHIYIYDLHMLYIYTYMIRSVFTHWISLYLISQFTGLLQPSGRHPGGPYSANKKLRHLCWVMGNRQLLTNHGKTIGQPQENGGWMGFIHNSSQKFGSLNTRDFRCVVWNTWYQSIICQQQIQVVYFNMCLISTTVAGSMYSKHKKMEKQTAVKVYS